MSNKRILIFFPHALKERFGGPYTYLYHLKNALSKHSQFVFLQDLVGFRDSSPGITSNRNHFSYFKKLFPRKLTNSFSLIRYLKGIKKHEDYHLISELDLNQFKAIHFHEALDIWRFSDLLYDYKGKIILTSHSPVPYHLELLREVFGWGKQDIYPFAYKALELIDITAFTKAHIIVSPCASAMDGYFKWDKYKALISVKYFKYIFTGIALPQIKEVDIKRTYSIPSEAFLVCYNGRHSFEKGYDLFLKAAFQIVNELPDVYFIVTGKIKVEEHYSHIQIVKTGWTDMALEIMSASDLVIIPNRETYFDLTLLEAISLNKPIITTLTGGNKCINAEFDSEDIHYLNGLNVIDLIDTVKKTIESIRQRNFLPQTNRTIFETNFTIEPFGNQYRDFYIHLNEPEN